MTSTPLIVADENIPCIAEALAGLGDVRLRPGRAMTADDVRDADVLLVRSVTRVDAALLDGSRVGFVGTATIGTDHLDLDYLATRGIPTTNAKGSNARSVAEWVVAAMLEIAEAHGFALAGRTLGIVGHGEIGTRVEPLARALGMHLLLCDPPKAESATAGGYVELDVLLGAADFVTFHVPLTKSGPHATHRMIGASQLGRMRPDAWLLNSARGTVVDNAALDATIDAGDLAGAVLDVWETEPLTLRSLAGRVFLGTPHIAGYSTDGKYAGTAMMAEAVARHLGVACPPALVPPPPARPDVTLAGGATVQASLLEAVRCSYPIREDDARLRATLALDDSERGKAFDRLRRDYPLRREFAAYTVNASAAPAGVAATLAKLGFKLRA